MPNWKSASDYAFTTKLDDIGWTWEFLRRNKEYREDYASVKADQKSAQEKFLDSQSKFSLESDVLPNGWALGAKWWINGPVRDPERNDPPAFIAGFPWKPDLQETKASFALVLTQLRRKAKCRLMKYQRYSDRNSRPWYSTYESHFQSRLSAGAIHSCVSRQL
jgi:hypothetical protein